ncbi:secretion protein, partial [Candidatus Pelagibacter sp.]|nr:secretion protein [Candidatus Pelagibacter sp.]
ISNSFGAMVTHNQSVTVAQPIDAQISGIEFNEDGTKMFTSYNKRLGGDDTRFIEEYNLSTPFNISTRVSAGDSERCQLTGVTANVDFHIFDITFSSDGMKFLVAQSADTRINSGDILSVFNLTSPYDVSTCVLASKNANLGYTGITNGSQAGDDAGDNRDHRLQGVEINDDGTKLFLLFSYINDQTDGDVGARLYEFTLPTPYDVSNLWDNNRTPKSTIVTTAGIELPDTVLGANNPGGMRFTPDGKRILIIGHESTNVLQISLTNAYDTSSYTIDGGINLNTGISPSNAHPRGVTFSASGLKLYIGNDNNAGTDQVMEYNLACPFNNNFFKHY